MRRGNHSDDKCSLESVTVGTIFWRVKANSSDCPLFKWAVTALWLYISVFYTWVVLICRGVVASRTCMCHYTLQGVTYKWQTQVTAGQTRQHTLLRAQRKQVQRQTSVTADLESNQLLLHVSVGLSLPSRHKMLNQCWFNVGLTID